MPNGLSLVGKVLIPSCGKNVQPPSFFLTRWTIVPRGRKTEYHKRDIQFGKKLAESVKKITISFVTHVSL